MLKQFPEARMVRFWSSMFGGEKRKRAFISSPENNKKNTCGKANCLLRPLGTRRRLPRPHRHPDVPFRTRPKK